MAWSSETHALSMIKRGSTVQLKMYPAIWGEVVSTGPNGCWFQCDDLPEHLTFRFYTELELKPEPVREYRVGDVVQRVQHPNNIWLVRAVDVHPVKFTTNLLVIACNRDGSLFNHSSTYWVTVPDKIRLLKAAEEDRT